MKDVKAHLVEPALVAIIDHKLSDAQACKLATLLLKCTSLKVSRLPTPTDVWCLCKVYQPFLVNRYLQSIVQHPSFFKISAFGAEVSSRTALVDLLRTLFFLHPSNTCQPSHVEPLVRAYGGTFGHPDREILSIFRLFESQRGLSVAELIIRWSTAPTHPSDSAAEALRSLDPVRGLRSCLAFPLNRAIDDLNNTQIEGREDVYDPLFVALLFARMLEEGTPTYGAGWAELFRTNCVGILLRCLSAKDPALRELALTLVAGLWKVMEVRLMMGLVQKPTNQLFCSTQICRRNHMFSTF
jgi:nucleolar pre-ribosomal-associated protein 1